MSASQGIQERGDQASALMFEACLESIRAREGGFGAARVLEHEGLRHIVVTELGPFRLLMNSDGVGTKIELAERLGDFTSIAFDLVAMLVDDAVRFGAQPLSMSNVLDCPRAEPEVVAQLAQGLSAAARTAEVSVTGGEVAELGPRSGGYNWSGTLLSVVPETALTGAALEAGQSVVALQETGFRSNGFTLARRILGDRFGPAWHAHEDWGRALLAPSRIYAPALLDAIGRIGQPGRVRVTGVVHVTGGGIPGKLGRLLRGRGLGAELDALFEPPAAMLELQRLGGIPDREAYAAWNMGQGMLAVTPEPEGLIELLARRGIPARVAGKLAPGSRLRIASRGALSGGSALDLEIQA